MKRKVVFEQGEGRSQTFEFEENVSNDEIQAAFEKWILDPDGNGSGWWDKDEEKEA